MCKYMIFKHFQSLQKWECKYILPCICMGFPYICITTFVQVYSYFLAFFDLRAFFYDGVQVYRKTNKSGLKRKKHGFSAAFLTQTRNNTNVLPCKLTQNYINTFQISFCPCWHNLAKPPVMRIVPLLSEMPCFDVV